MNSMSMLTRCFTRQWASMSPAARALVDQNWAEGIMAPGTLFSPPEGDKHVLWAVRRDNQSPDYTPHAQQLISLIEFPNEEAISYHLGGKGTL